MCVVCSAWVEIGSVDHRELSCVWTTQSAEGLLREGRVSGRMFDEAWLMYDSTRAQPPIGRVRERTPECWRIRSGTQMRGTDNAKHDRLDRLDSLTRRATPSPTRLGGVSLRCARFEVHLSTVAVAVSTGVGRTRQVQRSLHCPPGSTGHQLSATERLRIGPPCLVDPTPCHAVPT